VQHGIAASFLVGGAALTLLRVSTAGANSLELRTLFLPGMIRQAC